MMKLLLAVAAAGQAVPASASPPPAAPSVQGQEVRIPFVNFGGVRSFEADGQDSVYLQDRSRNWYRAELIGPCHGLPWALRIGIDSRGASAFDRFGTLLVDGERCQLRSLTRSGPPPRKTRAKHG
jgi:hypothetical protein